MRRLNQNTLRYDLGWDKIPIKSQENIEDSYNKTLYSKQKTDYSELLNSSHVFIWDLYTLV